MDREVKNGHCQPLAEVGNHPLAIGQDRPGRLGPRAKVVQTVVCSTFTRGAKPATRRVADGERMPPRGGWRVSADTEETSSTRATST
jgi:hypothetical protein